MATTVPNVTGIFASAPGALNPITGALRQIAANASASASGVSATGAVGLFPPSVRSAPVIISAATVGFPVAYQPGTYAGSGTITVTARQWLLNGSPISGATGTTYTPVAGDVGGALAIRETASGVAPPIQSTSSSVTVASAGGSAVVPSMWVEYVDNSGNRQRTTVASNGSTTITGVAPFLVHFNAEDSRSTDTNANDGPKAWSYLGYRLNYGEGIGGTWTYGGASRDEDTGPPIFGRAFTTTGSKNVRLKVRDTLGNEATLSMTVVVNAPPSPTIIETAGAWPTFASNSHYQLRAGQNYTSKGTLDTRGLHNVLFSKVGSGADPIIGRFCPDDRGFSFMSTGGLVRARHIRTLDIDVGTFYCNLSGYDYCGVIRGRCRQVGADSPGFYYDNNFTTSTQRTNCQYPRGTFLYEAGEMNVEVNDGVYVMIAGYRRLHLIGMVTNKNGGLGGGSGEHSFRNVMENVTYRHCNIYASVTTSTHFKGQGAETTSGDDSPDAWFDAHDQIGTLDGARKYGYPDSKIVIATCQFGRPGSTPPNVTFGFAPQNNDIDGTKEGIEYVAIEDCVGFNSDETLFNDEDFGGRYISMRNYKMSLGAGANSTNRTGVNPNKIPTGWEGPYLMENTNTRPVPTSF